MAKPKWTNVTVRLGDLKPWMDNPRLSTKVQAERIIKSFEKFGQVITVAVDPDFEVLDGHQRLGALLTLHGEDYKIEARQSDRKLSEEERLDLAVSLHAGATGSWDWQKLSSFPAPKLIEMGFDEGLKKQYDFDANNIKELLNSEKPEPVDAPAEIDRAAELQEKWQTRTGQLWKLADHKLLIGDCTVRENVERLMGGEKADMLLNDPPYGMRLDADFSGMENHLDFVRDKGVKSGRKYENVIGDFEDYNAAPVMALFEDVKEQLWFGADYYSATLGDTMHMGCWLIWDKRLEESADKMYGSCFEMAWSKNKHKRDILRHKWAGIFGTEHEQQRGRVHPNQKPVVLYEDLLNRYSNDGAIIVDCYAGSGTTIIAAHNLNRRCFAMEISDKYGAVILERFFTATGIQPELVTE